MGLKERRQREKEARRESILEAARDLLHRKGINGASMNQIAKKAELGVATLYSYFRSKEDLFLTLQQEGLELLKRQTIEAVGEEKDPDAKLRIVAQAYLDFSRNNTNYYYIINYFISSPEILFEPTLKEEIDQQAAESMGIREQIISEGIASGRYKAVNARHASIAFSALIHGLTQYQKLEQTVFAGESYMDIFYSSIQFFINSLKQS